MKKLLKNRRTIGKRTICLIAMICCLAIAVYALFATGLIVWDPIFLEVKIIEYNRIAGQSNVTIKITNPNNRTLTFVKIRVAPYSVSFHSTVYLYEEANMTSENVTIGPYGTVKIMITLKSDLPAREDVKFELTMDTGRELTCTARVP